MKLLTTWIFAFITLFLWMEWGYANRIWLGKDKEPPDQYILKGKEEIHRDQKVALQLQTIVGFGLEKINVHSKQRLLMKERTKVVKKNDHTIGKEELNPRHVHMVYSLEQGLFLPKVDDKETILSLANMTVDAYILANDTRSWRDVDGYKPDSGFGWDNTTLRGYVFTTPMEQQNHSGTMSSLVVVAFKGTSFEMITLNSERDKNRVNSLVDNDKRMDNIMFSCCCAHIDSSWKPVCSCFEKQPTAYSCQKGCIEKSVQEQHDSYFMQAMLIYDHVQSLYPHSSLWLVGHSLGGALASLVGIKTGWPSVTFESPGEKLYAQRLGWSVNELEQGKLNVWHFGNLGDPIFTGQCHGASSLCYYAGYALETACHLGHVCIYNQSHHLDILNHPILNVIQSYLLPFPLPVCQPQINCLDCPNWNFY